MSTLVRRDRPGLVVPFFGTVAEQKQRVRFGDLVGRRRGHLRRPLSSRLTRAGRAGRTGGSEWNGHAKRRNEGCDLHTPELFHKSGKVSYIRGMPVDPELLEILACPNCKTPVTLVKNGTALKCATCKRVYAIKDDIPVMLLDEATIEND